MRNISIQLRVSKLNGGFFKEQFPTSLFMQYTILYKLFCFSADLQNTQKTDRFHTQFPRQDMVIVWFQATGNSGALEQWFCHLADFMLDNDVQFGCPFYYYFIVCAGKTCAEQQLADLLYMNSRECFEEKNSQTLMS